MVDVAAASLIVSEASGVVTDLRGQPQRYGRLTRGAVFSNGLVHDALLAAVRRTTTDRAHDTVGVDVGIKSLVVAATADGTLVDAYEGVNALRTTQLQLRRANRPDLRAWPQRSSAHARTKPGSRGRATAKLRLQKLHAHVARQRRWLAHQITTELVRDCRRLVVEYLNVADMGRLRTLARALADAGLGDLRRLFEYKGRWFGTELVVADRWYPSSKTCSNPDCGNVKDTLLLSERTYHCDECGLELDRYLNAAVNLARWVDREAEPAHDPPLPAAA